jgi:hypothetical protein
VVVLINVDRMKKPPMLTAPDREFAETQERNPGMAER